MSQITVSQITVSQITDHGSLDNRRPVWHQVIASVIASSSRASVIVLAIALAAGCSQKPETSANSQAGVQSSTGQAAEPVAERDAEPGFDPAPSKLVIMTWNVEWMFDHDKSDNRTDLSREQSAPSIEYWQWKVNAVADAIAKCDATIVALQEIEGGQTLSDIAKALRERHQSYYRSAFIQGSDTFTEQDVGILQRTGLMHYRRHEQSKAMFDSELYYNVSKHIVGEFHWQDVASPLTVMNVHYRATADAEAERTRQGRLSRVWLEPQLDAKEDVIILGDLNSEHVTGELAGEMLYLVKGGPSSGGPVMVDLLERAPAEARRTHLILDKQFDRILVSPSLMEDAPHAPDWVFSEIAVRPELAIIGGGNDGEAHWANRLTMPTTELDVSDHAPIIATFELR